MADVPKAQRAFPLENRRVTFVSSEVYDAAASSPGAFIYEARIKVNVWIDNKFMKHLVECADNVTAVCVAPEGCNDLLVNVVTMTSLGFLSFTNEP